MHQYQWASRHNNMMQQSLIHLWASCTMTSCQQVCCCFIDGWMKYSPCRYQRVSGPKQHIVIPGFGFSDTSPLLLLLRHKTKIPVNVRAPKDFQENPPKWHFSDNKQNVNLKTQKQKIHLIHNMKRRSVSPCRWVYVRCVFYMWTKANFERLVVDRMLFVDSIYFSTM